MEFPVLGKRCAAPSCEQLDFLPFLCSHCGLIFCRDHYLCDYHDCCQKVDQTNAGVPTSEYFKCSNENCGASSPVSMLCQVCKKHFCLTHRHHGCLDKPPTEEEIQRWNAPREQFAAAKEEVDKQIATNLSKHTGKKNEATALKVQLMRLKGKAKGSTSVPMTDRAYFLVFTPQKCLQSSKAAFVSEQWVLGRVTDSLAETCGVPNRNNEANAPKLHLFRHKTGELLQPVSKTLKSFLDEGCLASGESLVLEYIPAENVRDKSLIDIGLYKE